MNDHVALREFIERVISDNDRRRDDLRSGDNERIDLLFASLRERFETSVATVNEARHHQAEEYKRRLEELNNAHERAEKVQASFVTREAWELDIKERRTTLERVEKDIAQRTLNSEFSAYKDATSRALLLREGQGHGVSLTTTAIVTIVSTVGVIIAMIVGLRLLGS